MSDSTVNREEPILAHDPSASKGLRSEGSDTIKSIETFLVKPRSWVFVRVETTNGMVGWGETMLDGHSDAVSGAFQDFQRLIGWDPANIQDIYQHLYRHRFHRGGPVLQSAIAGLDIALWDIKGKTLGVPIWQLLGGRVRDRVNVYGWVGGDSPKDVLDGAKMRKEQGFKVVKMNATDSLDWIDSPSKLDQVVERVKQVKSVGIDVGLDFHGRLHRGMAKQLARKLEPVEPFFIEEALLPTQLEEFKHLYQQTVIPIAVSQASVQSSIWGLKGDGVCKQTGERLFSRQECRPYFEASCMDICQCDVAHCGGISELFRIAVMAETYDICMAPHCPNGPLAFAATLQLGAALPNFLIAEMSWGMHYATKEADLMTYMKNPELFDVKDGSIAVWDKPGLGVEINEEMVRKAHEENAGYHWRVPIWRGVNGDAREW